MVPFGPAFVSTEVAAYEHEEELAGKQIDSTVTDSVERKRRRDEWEAAHPRPPPTLSQVADHIEHVRDVAGIDHVGIGSDFDGTSFIPVGLEDVAAFPR